jgi:hypothetical protein
MRNLLEEILAHHTGQPVERVRKDSDRDYIMSAVEAQEYGVNDEVLMSRELAEVGGSRVTELVELPAGVGLEQDAGPVVAESGPPGVPADVARADGRARQQAGVKEQWPSTSTCLSARGERPATASSQRGSRWA